MVACGPTRSFGDRWRRQWTTLPALRLPPEALRGAWLRPGWAQHRGCMPRVGVVDACIEYRRSKQATSCTLRQGEA
jgi:hypothetical protein